MNIEIYCRKWEHPICKPSSQKQIGDNTNSINDHYFLFLASDMINNNSEFIALPSQI